MNENSAIFQTEIDSFIFEYKFYKKYQQTVVENSESQQGLSKYVRDLC